MIISLMWPDELGFQGVFVCGGDKLVVVSVQLVGVVEVPGAGALWFIVLELSLVVSSVRVGPLSV